MQAQQETVRLPATEPRRRRKQEEMTAGSGGSVEPEKDSQNAKIKIVGKKNIEI